MKQEDKELLFKDLSARIPYHVRVKVLLKDGTTEEGSLDLQHNYADVLLSAFYYNKIVDIKPYLRPMSSITEVERKHWRDISLSRPDWDFTARCLDWLNSRHFDYRGLLERGLALEAPEDMYDI